MPKKKLYGIIAAGLAACLCITALVLMLTLGGGNEGSAGPSADETVPQTMTYTVTVSAESGLPLEGIGVYVYTDTTMQELVWFAKTDANGAISFTDVTSDSYIAVLSGVPEDFDVSESYPLTGELTEIRLTGGLAPVKDLESVTYALGDRIGDFTVTTADGTEYKISELLKEKKAVVLNFWYVQCVPCEQEFPYMEEAYRQYREDIEILAMNPVNTSPEEITEFQERLGLTFPMAAVEPEWEQAMQITAYPTTVVIDRFGNIVLVHKGSITDKQTFLNIFDFFSSDSYEPTVVKKVEDLPMAEDTLGTKENPYEFGGESSFQVKAKAGKEAYVVLYKISEQYLQINNPNAYVVYNDKTYYPNGGKVGLLITSSDPRTPVTLRIGNSGKKTETFEVFLSLLPGTSGNPYPMELGEFTVSVSAGNDQGVFYSYTAKTDGVLWATCLSGTAGVDYDYALYNLNTYVYRNWSYDGKLDEDGHRTLGVQMNAGDRLTFSVSTVPDSSFTYPAGSFRFKTVFNEGEKLDEKEQKTKITYAITVTDENRLPMKDVFFDVHTENGIKNISTNEKGVASVVLPEGTYRAVLVLPEGYTSHTTEYLMSPTVPVFSVKLKSFSVVMKDYTVKVVDEAGKPLSNVLVTVGSSFDYTDAAGSVRFHLQEGDYTAAVVPPENYVAESSGYPFPKGATELTITLKKGTDRPDDGNQTSYSVTVTDYFGKTQTGVVVQFLQKGEAVATVPVDAKGTAAASLPTGSYTARLVFSGESLYYEEKNAVLTAQKPAITLQVAPAVSGKAEQLYVGKAYHVDVGGTYVTLQANAMNYFIFTAVQSGVYRFTTSDPAAVISFQGSSTSFIADMTAGTDYKDNAFTMNIKESNLEGVYILGITGAEDCILEISRIGDAILDETDMEREIYKAKTPPKPFTLNLPAGKKLTYVDLTAATTAYVPVYNETDGFYHLNAKNGPVLYVNLGHNAPYMSMYDMLGYQGFGGTSLLCYFYGADGKVSRIEDYTACMCSYVESIDENTGVYPLTEDLKYMLQQGGGFKGWWDSENANYLFSDVKGLNPEIAWMFACCYAS